MGHKNEAVTPPNISPGSGQEFLEPELKPVIHIAPVVRLDRSGARCMMQQAFRYSPAHQADPGGVGWGIDGIGETHELSWNADTHRQSQHVPGELVEARKLRRSAGQNNTGRKQSLVA